MSCRIKAEGAAITAYKTTRTERARKKRTINPSSARPAILVTRSDITKATSTKVVGGDKVEGGCGKITQNLLNRRVVMAVVVIQVWVRRL